MVKGVSGAVISGNVIRVGDLTPLPGKRIGRASARSVIGIIDVLSLPGGIVVNKSIIDIAAAVSGIDEAGFAVVIGIG